jgi:hypothetical protein
VNDRGSLVSARDGIYTAEGRFSAGLPAQQLINPCE